MYNEIQLLPVGQIINNILSQTPLDSQFNYDHQRYRRLLAIIQRLDEVLEITIW